MSGSLCKDINCCTITVLRYHENLEFITVSIRGITAFIDLNTVQYLSILAGYCKEELEIKNTKKKWRARKE